MTADRIDEHSYGYMTVMNSLPVAVGPNTAAARGALLAGTPATMSPAADPFDRDTQLAWFMLNETSFGGWRDVDDDAEWDPAVVGLRRQFENWFVDTVGVDRDVVDPVGLVRDILAADDGVSMSRYLSEFGTSDQVMESLQLRHPYQSKEADPHTFAIPRLSGTVKRALCEIQSGEYGVGHRSTHAELFCDALAALDDLGDCGLVERLPGVAFATSNLVTMGGLNRARRGIAVGQLALFEMDSVKPNGTMVEVCDRLQLPAATRRFFDVHVMADAEHEVIAQQAFLIDYPIREPEQLCNVLFGIRAQHVIDVALAHHALRAWTNGVSALVDDSVGDGGDRNAADVEWLSDRTPVHADAS